MTNIQKCGKIVIENGKAKCPYCGSGKLLDGGIGPDTVVRNLHRICKRCKREINVNIEPEPESNETSA